MSVDRGTQAQYPSLMATKLGGVVEHAPLTTIAKPDEVDGLCKNADPDIFFPHSEVGALRAIEICEQCPVRQACAKAALDKPSNCGVWAGIFIPYDHQPRVRYQLQAIAEGRPIRREKRPVDVEAANLLRKQGETWEEIGRQLGHNGRTVQRAWDRWRREISAANRKPPNLPKIEARRERVAELTAQGWTVREIAVELGFSEGTITRDKHILGIAKKRTPRAPEDIEERVQLVAALTREGLSAAEIAIRLGVTQKSVVRYRRRAGVSNYNHNNDTKETE